MTDRDKDPNRPHNIDDLVVAVKNYEYARAKYDEALLKSNMEKAQLDAAQREADAMYLDMDRFAAIVKKIAKNLGV